MNDYIIRAIAANDQIRAFAAVTTETVETARQDHNARGYEQLATMGLKSTKRLS